MHWPRSVRKTFEAAAGAAESHDNLYPGAYNQLLHILFPPEGRCVVTPHYQLVADAYGGPDVVHSYEVSWEDYPLLVLQVRPPWHLDSRSKREAADRQLAQRMLDLQGSSLLTEFCGISAMGTKLCFYTFSFADGGLSPALNPATTVAVDTAPRSRWNGDVLQSSGKRRLRLIVKDIEESLPLTPPGVSPASSGSSD